MFRQNRASEDIATWTLTKLLKEDVINYITCSVPQKNPEKLFNFEILNDEQSIKAASGSVYYPMEVSEIIQKIQEIPGHYTTTDLPCFIESLKLATQKTES